MGGIAGTEIGLLFSQPVMRPLSTSGQFQSGCYLVFTSGGALATVYRDPECIWPFNLTSIPGSGPPSQNAVTSGLQSDATGRFPPIFLLPSIEYTYILYSAAGVALETGPTTGVNVANGPVAVVATKVSSTSRSNTTVLVNDPDLQVAITQPGTYRIEMDLAFDAGAALTIEVAFSGTTVTETLALFGAAPWPSTSVQKVSLVNTAISSIGGSGANVFRIVGSIQVSTAGTVSFQWAQASASATQIASLLAGSTLTVQKLT